MEKKQKKVDSQINEWKIKCSELQSEIDVAQKNARVASSEVLKGRASFQGMTVFQSFIYLKNTLKNKNLISGKLIFWKNIRNYFFPNFLIPYIS